MKIKIKDLASLVSKYKGKEEDIVELFLPDEVEKLKAKVREPGGNVFDFLEKELTKFIKEQEKKIGVPGQEIEIPYAHTQAIKQALKDNKSNRPLKGQSNGKLTFNRLPRYKFTDKIFQKKMKAGKKEYSIVVLVDCSGSMSEYSGKNRRIDSARDAVKPLIKSLQKECNLAVWGFTKEIHRWKNLKGTLTNEEIAEIQKDIYARSNNHDHEAIDEACKVLNKTEGRKIIIILSDGQPSCNCGSPTCYGNHPIAKAGGGSWEILKASVNKAVSSGITVLGIGIQTDIVKNFYRHNTVINDAKEILPATIKLLKQAITK